MSTDDGRDTDAPDQPPVERKRRVIHATCVCHGGARDFTNVVMTKRDNVIVLDPHAIGACVIEFNEEAATAVRDQFSEWLG